MSKTDMTKIKRIDIKQFVDYGYLQELNRLFLHPLGLALEVKSKQGQWKLGGIWDYREDPEGMMFDESEPPDADKAERVLTAWEAHETARLIRFSSAVQPDSKERKPPCCAYHCHNTL